MRRVVAYFGACALIQATAVVVRFTVWSGWDLEKRFPIAGALAVATVVLLGLANVYESRLVAHEARITGLGTLGQFRGWVKTIFVELAVDDAQISPETERRYRMFRLAMPYALLCTFAVCIVVIA